MSLKNASIQNSRGGSLTFSNTENKEFVTLNTYEGSNVTLSKIGVSVFSPNNHQKNVSNDDFESINNDKSIFVGGKKFDRINSDYSIVIGDSIAFHTDAYELWNEKFTELAIANSQPNVKKPVSPVIPGVAAAAAPKFFPDAPNLNISNPALTELKDNIKSGKVLNDLTIPKVKFSLKSKPDLKTVQTFVQKAVKKAIDDKVNDVVKFKDSIVKSVQSIPNLVKNLQIKSPSTQGGDYPVNTSKESIPDLITKTQEELIPIEANLGDGGSMNVNVARNVRWVVGAAVNNNPQANVDMVGKQSPNAVVITGDGTTTAVTGTPQVNEIDNHSMFPCGTFTLEIGNGFNVKAGGGGISLVTSGSINIASDTVLKIGGLQTVVGSKDVVIKGENNVSIESPNLNLTSENQILANGNLGVNSNLLLKGGGYVNGELFINHITAPREIQQTLVGFTKEGALGFLRSGVKITGFLTLNNVACTTNNDTVTSITIIKQPFTLDLDQQSDLAVELTPHGHEFPNIPLTLAESSGNTSAQGALRSAAAGLNVNSPAGATGIVNGSKFPKQPVDPKSLIANNSSQSVNVTGV
jgi:hypothetical protein